MFHIFIIIFTIIRSSDVLDVYPTTPLQSSFLMASMRVSDAYIVTQSWDLPPRTERDKLRQVFEDFINHPNGMMFRTVFILEPLSNQWLQVLIRPGTKQMEWIIITVADEQELDMRVAEYQRTQAIKRFDNRKLLTRACIFELHGSARILVWSVHHALVDHWAMDSIISDLEQVYAGRSLSSRRPFKAMVKYLQNRDRTSSLAFWERHLYNASPTSFLQRKPNAVRSTANATVSREINFQHGSLTCRFGIMPSTLVTSAWSVVLSAHSGSSDVVFGQVLAGRSRSYYLWIAYLSQYHVRRPYP